MSHSTASNSEPASSQPKTNLDRNTLFLQEICELYQTDRGKIAALKRNCGNTMATARGLSWFYYYLLRAYPGYDSADNNLCLLVASMMTFDRPAMREGVKIAGPANLGASLAALRTPEERANQRPGSTPIERRLVALLDSTFEPDFSGEMAYRLRQTVRFALSKEVRIHWPKLIEDLRHWSAPTKYVQKAWARSFYSVPAPAEADRSDPAPILAE
jgi:CRISPR system Cascade subunit CasB